MENAGRERRLGLCGGKNLLEMFDPTGAAGCNDRDGDRLCHGIDQFNVKTQVGAVAVDAIEQNFSGTQFFK